MEKVKEHLHILVLLNLVLTFLSFFSGESAAQMSFINIAGGGNENPEVELKKAICELGFKNYRDGNLSNYYFHPDIIANIKENSDDDFKVEGIEKFYFQMEGRDICRVIGRKKEGFVAFNTVISSNGPLLYRITSIESKKPTYEEVKGYL